MAAAVVTLDGKTYRAVVVHSSNQAQRRQQHRARARQASFATLAATRREVAPQAYACRADAEAAAAKLRTVQSAYHRLEAMVEEHPQ